MRKKEGKDGGKDRGKEGRKEGRREDIEREEDGGKVAGERPWVYVQMVSIAGLVNDFIHIRLS